MIALEQNAGKCSFAVIKWVLSPVDMGLTLLLVVVYILFIKSASVVTDCPRFRLFGAQFINALENSLRAYIPSYSLRVYFLGRDRLACFRSSPWHTWKFPSNIPLRFGLVNLLALARLYQSRLSVPDTWGTDFQIMRLDPLERLIRSCDGLCWHFRRFTRYSSHRSGAPNS
jgi:hypothetical protein